MPKQTDKVGKTRAPEPGARQKKPAVKQPAAVIQVDVIKAQSKGKKTAAQPAAGAVPAEPAETAPKEKAKKQKMVRDSFTMPENEYKVLGEVKRACLKAGVEVKKSELLRIGVELIRQLDVLQLQAVLATLPQTKAGRPKKEK